MPKPRDRGFFDKINNAFFVMVDFAFDFLEKRGWNIPLETRFFFHGFLFIALFYYASSILLQTFYLVEGLLLILILTTFGVANIRPIRQVLGYYTSDEKIRTIVNKINNNQISIRAVVEHLSKNLLPPHLTLSIIHAYQKKGKGLPPELIRAILRQPTSIGIVEEIIKNDLTDGDFSLLMRKYKNLLNKNMLLKVVNSQKFSESKLCDTFFYQESAYKAMKEMSTAISDRDLIPMLWVEKDAYRKRPLLKNFLRNHHQFLSIFIPLLFAAFVAVPLYFSDPVIGLGIGLVLWIVLFEFLYSYFIEYLYLRV